MKHSFPRVITLSLLAALALHSAHAGEAAKSIQADKIVKPTPVEKSEASPLSFLDGRVVFDVEERLRGEWSNNIRDFNSAVNDPSDDGELLSRFRLGLKLKPVSWFTLYGQGQDSREFFSGRPKDPGVNGANGDDNFDLRQAYVTLGDFKSFPLAATVGRQPLGYGSGRFVEDSKWSNFGRTFDAAKLRLQTKVVSVDLFYANVVQIERDQFDESDHNQKFGGLFAATEALPGHLIEAYTFYLDSDASSNAGQVWTFGARLKSVENKKNPWDYEFEAAGQTGTAVGTVSGKSQDLDLSAFGAHAGVGYTWQEADWTPRVALNYDYASGDSNPNDGKSNRLFALYPTTHNLNGLLDATGWANIQNPYLQLSVKPVKGVKVGVEYHLFWLADTSDYAYRSNGSSPIRTKTPDGRDVRTIGASSFLGNEIDFVADYQVNDWLKLHGGYSILFAGDYLADTGASSNAQYVYLQATISF